MRSCEIQNLWESKLIIAFSSNAHYLKITQSVAFELLNFDISTNFCPIKSELSGNTVWQQASDFQKFAKMDNFCHF